MELRLYKVTITNFGSRKIEFIVATWNGPYKAVAMAVGGNEARSRPIAIHDVAVEDLGAIGSASIPAKALVDRMEF